MRPLAVSLPDGLSAKLCLREGSWRQAVEAQSHRPVSADVVDVDRPVCPGETNSPPAGTVPSLFVLGKRPSQRVDGDRKEGDKEYRPPDGLEIERLVRKDL